MSLLQSIEAVEVARENFIQACSGLSQEEIIYPHPLSGPLNVYQRMEFLRYHMERHQRQIEQIKQQYRGCVYS